MKSYISLLLAACILLASIFTLTSCLHKCEFSDEWTSDGISHWHVCTDEKCEEVSEKAEHTFNDGEITVKATQETVGVKTYTCSVCNDIKEESIAFTGLNEEEWNDIFSEEAFANFTYSEEAVVKYSGIEITTTALYKFTETKVYASLTMAGQTAEETATGLQAANTKKDMINSIKSMLKYGIFEYDAENKIYNLTGDMRIESLNTSAKSATLRFENGKPVELTYTCIVVSNGISMDGETTVTFSDFGTTVIP